MTGNNSDLVDFMAFIEENLASLYMSFAQRFPKDAFFWKQVADEEKEQAQLIRSFSDELANEPASSMPSSFSKNALESTLTFLKVAEKKDFESAEDALEAAEWLEKSLLDMEILKKQSSGIPDSAKVFRMIERKKQRCTKMIAEYRDMKKAD